MRAYKVKTFNDIERDIDVYCMIFGVLFCLSYLTILFSGILLLTYEPTVPPNLIFFYNYGVVGKESYTPLTGS